MYAYIRQGPVINQELVPSGHFIQVVEMRTDDSKNITATVMRQSFVRPCVYACVCMYVCVYVRVSLEIEKNKQTRGIRISFVAERKF